MAPTASFWDSGEFIAVAHGLQVNHPPGAPFYSLLGRVFSMFMPASYVAISINFISALTSALTVMFLYLIIIRLVKEFRGDADKLASIDKIGMYGGALLGAFAFSVTDTFWFNAAEAEVYAPSMFFTAIVVWLALKWAEHHKEPNNERWLVLIAYMFGLALGVHLLNLLALFFVALIIYFKKKDFTLISFAIMGAIAAASFLVIYPFTVQMLPGIMESFTEASYGLIGPIAFITLVILTLAGGIYFTHKKQMRIANIVMLSYAMIIIGYSSYSLIFIRSIADPPIDENDPETVEAFISYLEREQYGQTPLLTGQTYDNSLGGIDQQEEIFFPRRYSGSSAHLQRYSNYSSDWDFFIDYQVNHMYIRYFNWNFIGRESDIQDTGWQAGFAESEYEDNPAHNSYFYLPFLLGLFGLIFHFQRDWKRALSVLALFIMTGFAIIVFLNQTPLQPRERDYAYVGSFFAFAIWIGMGGVGMIELVKEHLKSNAMAAYGILGILFLGIPGLMGYQNFDDHDRSERYVAPDYAYNLLNSVAPNALIFTNGDNDTFPLWYLQEVEGIRTDVRVVNLSLLNTEWYIKQMRDQWSHESPPLPISYTDEEIEQLTPNLHQPDTINIPVNKNLLETAFSGPESYKESIDLDTKTSHTIFKNGIGFNMPVDSLDKQVSWYYKGRPYGTYRNGDTRYITQVQDQVILNILRNNNWLRPVYFANTVPQSNQLNLQSYFRSEGKAYRVVPKHHKNSWLNPSIFTERLKEFRFRKWDHPDTYLDANIRGMMRNYYHIFSNLANKYISTQQPDSAKYWLDWGHERLPLKKTTALNPFTTLLYAHSYSKAGAHEPALDLVSNVKVDTMEKLKANMSEFNSIRTEVSQIRKQTIQARRNANVNQKRQLQEKIQDIKRRRGQIRSEFSNSIVNLLIMQRIYFLADNEQKALALANQVNKITGNRIDFPKTRKTNKQEVNRFGI